MITIRKIDAAHEADIRLPNEPFRLYGKIEVTRAEGAWAWKMHPYPESEVREMCFPDENYSMAEMPSHTFLGAYDGEECVGLAVLSPGFFRYLYLDDLKVKRARRGEHIGRMLIEAAEALALEMGFRGIYTIGQDDNPGACLFYLHNGFVIGGFDTMVYTGTSQEGKSDIIFYRTGQCPASTPALV